MYQAKWTILSCILITRRCLEGGAEGLREIPKPTKAAARGRIERAGSTKQRANVFEKGLRGKWHLFLKPLQQAWAGSKLGFSSGMRMRQPAGCKPPAAAKPWLPTRGQDTVQHVPSCPISTSTPCSRQYGPSLTSRKTFMGTFALRTEGSSHCLISRVWRGFPNLTPLLDSKLH